ncbi:MAG TPA: Dabb family protein [Acidimicrobiales bacterium]|nr:Dabb family protein [Acidimicrobiales bacterium]
MPAIRHVVVFRFQPGTTGAQRDAIATALRRLPALIPEIADYTVGDDRGLVEGNWDFGVVADFASEDDYFAYRDHPDHRAVIADLIRPVVAERAAVQLPTG